MSCFAVNDIPENIKYIFRLQSTPPLAIKVVEESPTHNSLLWEVYIIQEKLNVQSPCNANKTIGWIHSMFTQPLELSIFKEGGCLVHRPHFIFKLR